ncbi:hypothetical protein EYR38_003207 [Pleurotus pulmonarius]|nr:hypothetical protein EYR38_003207 [Pleurotus pulmonarius]
MPAVIFIHTMQKVAVNQSNINYGGGVFNTVNGTQNFTTNITWNLHNGSTPNTASLPLIELYQSAIGAAFDILRLLERLPETSAVSTIRNEVEGFVPALICVAKAMEIIRRVSPLFATHTFFANMDSQAIDCGRRLKELKTDIHEYSVHLGDIMLSSTDFALVVFQHFRSGPASAYIESGHWEAVRVGDNRVIRASSFTGSLTPEAVLDIGVIMQLLAASLHVCPQCGHGSASATAETWVSCSNPACGNIFRVMLATDATASGGGTDGRGSRSALAEPGCSQSGARTKFRRVSAQVQLPLVSEPEGKEDGKLEDEEDEEDISSDEDRPPMPKWRVRGVVEWQAAARTTHRYRSQRGKSELRISR